MVPIMAPIMVLVMVPIMVLITVLIMVQIISRQGIATMTAGTTGPGDPVN